MSAYLVTLITSALAVTLISILAPSGERGGLTQGMRLITALFLVCVLVSPIRSAIGAVRELLDGELSIPGLDSPNEDSYREELDAALGDASTEYFSQALTRMLEGEFSIETGQIRCRVDWQTVDGRLSPRLVTVILSGRAIWKDAGAIERYVEELLGCDCVSAIE